MNNYYLNFAIKQFQNYKSLGEKTFNQLNDEQLFWQYNSDSNSIAIIIKHLSGNMLSRWTNFLTSDGEKDWRQRDSEFEEENIDRLSILQKWENGWHCLFDALNSLTEQDLTKIILIRKEEHLVMEAINRQLTHYAYHVGQIVFIGKMLKKENWNSLSIPKGKSEEFNITKGL